MTVRGCSDARPVGYNQKTTRRLSCSRPGAACEAIHTGPDL
jgi:hypothetical protein